MVFTCVALLFMLVIWGWSRVSDVRCKSTETLEKKVVDPYIETGAVSTSLGLASQ